MNRFYALWKKEMMVFFLSPVVYVLGVFFLVVMGIGFWLVGSLLMGGIDHYDLVPALFGESIFFWITLLIVAPVLTMRSFAEEKRAGTFETLMTAPVTETSVALAKYFSSLYVFFVLWVPTLFYLYILRRFIDVTVPLDAGAVIGAYAGAGLIGAFFVAVGVYASTFTSSQIASAMLSFAALFGVFVIGFVPYVIPEEPWRSIVEYVSAVRYMMDFSRGIIDSRAVVLCVSATACMLFFTVRNLEARKLK